MSTSRASLKTTPLKATERNFSLASSRPQSTDPDQPRWDMRTVKQHLEKEIGHSQHANVELETFALHVWGITDEDVIKFKGKAFIFPSAAYTDFKYAKQESSMHTPFHTLVAYLINESLGLFNSSVADTTTPAIWDHKGTKFLHQEGRKRKPDVLVLWDNLKPDNVWAATKFIVEFKNTLVKEPTPRVPGRGFGSDPTAAPTSKVGEKRKHQAATQVSQKKSRKDRGDLARKYLQLAAYGLEVMAATSRFWVIGLTFEKFKVTVCYFDRFHVIRSLSFDFESAPWKLALVLYGLNRSDSRQAGYDPCLRTLPSDALGSGEDSDGNQGRSVGEAVGSFFEFTSVTIESQAFADNLGANFDSSDSDDDDGPSPSEDTSDSEGTSNGSEPSSEESVHGSEKGHNEVPEHAAPATSTGPIVLLVKKLLRRPDDLIGRGTTVYKVVLRLVDGSYGKSPIALKQSWPIARRKSETDIVRELKKRLPEQAHAYLPEFLFSLTSTAEELRLPWIGMGLTFTEDNYQARVLRRIGSKFYKPLWKAGGLSEFKKVFVDCIQIHFLAYQIGKVLHRDISENNLMVGSSADGNRGVLNDWDMAKFVEDAGDMLTAANHRTASMPFLAASRLSSPALGHFYRHELEAFFYVLVWAAVHYDLSSRTRDAKVNHILVPWTQGAKANGDSKLAMLSMEGEVATQAVCAKVKPNFKPLVGKWITPLRNLLSEAMQNYKADVRSGAIKEGESAETLNGHLTFKLFMAAMGYNETNANDWAIIPGILDL